MLDQEVQGGLIGRVSGYWVICLAATLLADLCWRAWTAPAAASFTDSLRSLAPGLIGSFFLLPLVIADLLRMSNRFVAPIHNLRNALKRLELGDRPDRLATRKGDFWIDVTTRFNRLLEVQTEVNADQTAGRET